MHNFELCKCLYICIYINGIHRNKVVEGHFGIQRNQLVNVPIV